jgi:hypothetical protein
MWTSDVDNSIICNYRGFDIFKINSGFAIKQFSFFKWPTLQDATYHIDRHCGGGKGTIVWKTKLPPQYQNIKGNQQKVFEKGISDTKEIVDIKEIYSKIKTNINKGELMIVTDDLLSLISESYSKDIIDDKFIESIKDNLDRLEKVMGYISSDNSNEAKVANDKSLKLCSEILASVNNVAKIESVKSCQMN